MLEHDKYYSIKEAVIEEIRKELSRLTDYAHQPYRIVDSMPITVCKFGRARFHKAFRGYGAAYGRCPSKKVMAKSCWRLVTRIKTKLWKG